MIKKIALDSFLGGYYHQDVWFDHKTHEEIWADYLNTHPETDVKNLLRDIDSLKNLTDHELKSYLEENSTGGLYFGEGESSREWIMRLKKHLSQKV